ncbi:MAG TPA: PEGA domain-containing protein [Polyangiaceae bacterium]|nr:PEGA domain-containing protein [Polyangiaceae bacterium]
MSEAALSRAASVDPGRTVQAAEARPEVAARAREISQAALTGPRGSFEVRADAQDAVVSLDDTRVGALPTVIEASVGPHVIRIDAPGYHAWARVVTVFEGSRPPLEVTLSPTLRRAAVVRARRSIHSGDRSGLSAYFALDGAPPIVHLRPGAGVLDRALLTVCRRDGCAGPRLLESPLDSAFFGRGLEVTAAPLATSPRQAARWLTQSSPPTDPTTPWWERWYVWTVAGAVLAAGVGAALGIVSSQQAQSDPPLILIVDPGGLPRSGVD